MLGAGKFHHKITIQKQDPNRPRNTAGQKVATWIDAATDIFANVEPISGRDAFLAAQAEASTTHKVTVRYGPRTRTVDHTHRILFRGRIFYLDRDPINVDERGIDLVMECTEGLRTVA